VAIWQQRRARASRNRVKWAEGWSCVLAWGVGRFGKILSAVVLGNEMEVLREALVRWHSALKLTKNNNETKNPNQEKRGVLSSAEVVVSSLHLSSSCFQIPVDSPIYGRKLGGGWQGRERTFVIYAELTGASHWRSARSPWWPLPWLPCPVRARSHCSFCWRSTKAEEGKFWIIVGRCLNVCPRQPWHSPTRCVVCCARVFLLAGPGGGGKLCRESVKCISPYRLPLAACCLSDWLPLPCLEGVFSVKSPCCECVSHAVRPAQGCISVPWDSFPGTHSDTRRHGAEPSRALVPVGLGAGEMDTAEGSTVELLLCGQSVLTARAAHAWELVSEIPQILLLMAWISVWGSPAKKKTFIASFQFLKSKPIKGSTEPFLEAILPFPGFGESGHVFLSRFMGFCWGCGWGWERASTDKASDSASPRRRESPLLRAAGSPRHDPDPGGGGLRVVAHRDEMRCHQRRCAWRVAFGW